jgi:hypothetical protein
MSAENVKGECPQGHSKCPVEVKVDEIMKAIPNGDMAGHHDYHMSVIERNRATAEFFRKMTFELAKWGLFALIAFLATSAWQNFLKGPK